MLRSRSLLVIPLIALSVTACGASGDITAGGGSSGSSSASGSKAAKSAPADDVTDLALGKSVTATGVDEDGKTFKVSVTVKTVKTAKRGVYDIRPKKGQFLGAQVVYECKKATCNYNVFDWKLRNAEGEDLGVATAFDPALASGTLKPGKKAQGWVSFDVPAKKAKYSLEYQSNVLSNNVANWVIAA